MESCRAFAREFHEDYAEELPGTTEKLLKEHWATCRVDVALRGLCAATADESKYPALQSKQPCDLIRDYYVVADSKNIHSNYADNSYAATLAITVFSIDNDPRRRDLMFLSAGLIGKRDYLYVRRPEVNGPYRRFIVQVEVRGEQARVVSCREDERFDSAAYERKRIAKRVRGLLSGFFRREPETVRENLPDRADVPFPGRRLSPYPGEVHLAENEGWLQSNEVPFTAAVRIIPRGHARPSPEAEVIPGRGYEVAGQYARGQNRIEISRCEEDPEVHEFNVRRREVAEFVRRYLTGTEKFRHSVRIKGGEYEYTGRHPHELKGLHRLWYRRIREARKGWRGRRVWRTRIIFWFKVKEGSYGRQFRCRVSRTEQGDWRVISDRWVGPPN